VLFSLLRLCPAPSAFAHDDRPIRHNNFLNGNVCFGLAESLLETGHSDFTNPMSSSN
jgi:hypothetical protein